MQLANKESKFVVCISHQNYPASLEVRKIYQVIPDADEIVSLNSFSFKITRADIYDKVET